MTTLEFATEPALCPGIFVAVVGASGAGKDSLIDYARERSSSSLVRVVRRVVTRPADACSEDHDSLTPEAFALAEEQGRFALSWSAHGLSYGLPVALDDDLAAGRIVVANLSRAILPDMLARYPQAVVVAVTAHQDVIAKRLALRGRESNADLAARISRNVAAPWPANTVPIDNSGELEAAGEKFMHFLQLLMQQCAERKRVSQD